MSRPTWNGTFAASGRSETSRSSRRSCAPLRREARQLLNVTDLARDLGLAVNTVKAWISVLEATYQVIILRPYCRNVAVASDSRSSLSSRAFSMAMTAWLAKFCTSSICLSVNGRTSRR